jgi:hypothetical protein
VLLVVEAESPTHREAAALDEDYAVTRASWPHLDDAQAHELWSHHLGYLTWRDLAGTFGSVLPATRDEASRI